MLYREIMAVCSQIHTKHINALCGQNVELLNVKLAVHIVTTGLEYSYSRMPYWTYMSSLNADWTDGDAATEEGRARQVIRQQATQYRPRAVSLICLLGAFRTSALQAFWLLLAKRFVSRF